MNDMEKRVWAATYALYWKEFMEVVASRAMRGHYHREEEDTGDWQAAEVSATESAVERADYAVYHLRIQDKGAPTNLDDWDKSVSMEVIKELYEKLGINPGLPLLALTQVIEAVLEDEVIAASVKAIVTAQNEGRPF